MYCKACGKKIDDDSVFCKHCGRDLSGGVNNGRSEPEERTDDGKWEISPEKKKLMIFGCLFAVSVVLLICGTVRALALHKRIIGEYMYERVLNGGIKEITESTRLELKSNGSFIMVRDSSLEGYSWKKKGSWSITENDELCLTYRDSVTPVYYDYSSLAKDEVGAYGNYYCPIFSAKLYLSGAEYVPVNPTKWLLSRMWLMLLSVMCSVIFYVEMMIAYRDVEMQKVMANF